ncbi:dihydroorotase [Erythrobacteraceae bacterium CFH 75059]|uniref:dihydroorotase n=1 Tax=Qipengyuania thermophila TaxID=2509361 RepID=UPI001021194B|nr:dihydroorotase [Qipengyuania thermophila]TCD05507.1 dihydroorotase [Erythrobacteraceae bacterium CFH 75059]
MRDQLTIRRPDDWHLHLRDGPVLRDVLPYTARVFGRAIVMPNLSPPVTTTAAARAYRDRILAALPDGSDFTPLMTCYLTDETQSGDLIAGYRDGVFAAAKLYPAHATTNSAGGVTDVHAIMPVLEAMCEAGMPLCVHGEVTDAAIDIFDREAVFIDRVLAPLLDRLPDLRVIFEHVTTRQAVQFVDDGPANLAATITPQHLHLNRNAMLVGGIRPHTYCLPVLKREEHRLALRRAATSGSLKYFLGTDSAPHLRATKESACGCAGIFNAPQALESYAAVFEEEQALDRLETFASVAGALFYRLPLNTGTVTLRREPQQVPGEIAVAEETVVPFHAGETLRWRITPA